MEKSENKYFIKYFYPEKSLIIAETTIEIEDIGPNTYKKQLNEIFNWIEKYKPKYFVYNALTAHHNVLPPDMQIWVYENFIKKINEKTEKAAFIIKNLLFMKISVEKTLEYEKRYPEKNKIFHSMEEAEKWLFEN